MTVMMAVMIRDVRAGIELEGNGRGGDEGIADAPQVVLVVAGTEYGPVRLDLIGDPPMPVAALATMSDQELKARVASHFDLTGIDLDKHVVVRPGSNNIVISEPTVLG